MRSGPVPHTATVVPPASRTPWWAAASTPRAMPEISAAARDLHLYEAIQRGEAAPAGDAGAAPVDAEQITELEEELERLKTTRSVPMDAVAMGKVEPLASGDHRVTVVDVEGQESAWQTKFLVDASGRDTLLSGKRGWKHRNPKHASAAVFSHFRGSRRRAGEREGDMSIYWFEHVWV